VALEAKVPSRVNLGHLHQDHLCIARLTTHRTSPTTTEERPSLM
jgi:hypothetical protein